MAIPALQRYVVFCLLCIPLVLGACAGLTKSDKPAVTTWWLIPSKGLAQIESNQQATLKPVSVKISAVPGLDTDRILTLTTASELKPYSNARWADSLPELSESLIGRSLSASGRYEVLSSGNRRSSQDCKLGLEIREFFTRLDSSGQTSQVMVAFDGYFQCGSGALVPIHLSSSLPVEDSRMRNIVATFQKALDGVMKDLLGQL